MNIINIFCKYVLVSELLCTDKFSLSHVEWQTQREILNQLSSVSVILWNYLNSLKIIIIINLKVLLYIYNLIKVLRFSVYL